MLAIMTELSAITAANKTEYGRLAQLVEHLLDVQGVRDSSSLPSTRGAVRAIVRAAFFMQMIIINTGAVQTELPLYL